MTEPSRPPAVLLSDLALDTDAFSWLFNRDRRTEQLERLVANKRIVLPFPVVAELRAGALINNWGPDRIAAQEAAISNTIVIPSTDAVAHLWSLMRRRFRNQLKGEGINDMWVAACCLAHDVPVATGNLSDFSKIQSAFPQLRIEPVTPPPRATGGSASVGAHPAPTTAA